jgi:hypothetical protein
MKTNLEKVGPCGTACSECVAAKDDPRVISHLVANGFPASALPCKGCRAIDGHCPSPSLQGRQCGIFSCVRSRNLTFCYECEEAPCARLSPVENPGRYRYHNTKTFNLLYLRNRGLDAFCADIKKLQERYFGSELTVVGEPPEPKAP